MGSPRALPPSSAAAGSCEEVDDVLTPKSDFPKDMKLTVLLLLARLFFSSPTVAATVVMLRSLLILSGGFLLEVFEFIKKSSRMGASAN